MAAGPPRPKQNSEGGKKKPSANPDGQGAPPAGPPAAPGQPMGPPNTAPPVSPGQMQVMQTAGQLQGAPGIPNTPGAGVPEGLQSFPQDAAALMDLMKQGYAPGADNMMHAQAQNAHAIAKAQEAAAMAQANDQLVKQQAASQLGALLQKLMGQGQLPHPEEAAMAAVGQGPPQLSSGLTGGAQGSPAGPAPRPPAY